MIKLLQRINKGEIEICCIGVNGEHLWVNQYDFQSYIEDEMKRLEKIEVDKNEH